MIRQRPASPLSTLTGPVPRVNTEPPLIVTMGSKGPLKNRIPPTYRRGLRKVLHFTPTEGHDFSSLCPKHNLSTYPGAFADSRQPPPPPPPCRWRPLAELTSHWSGQSTVKMSRCPSQPEVPPEVEGPCKTHNPDSGWSTLTLAWVLLRRPLNVRWRLYVGER